MPGHGPLVTVWAGGLAVAVALATVWVVPYLPSKDRSALQPLLVTLAAISLAVLTRQAARLRPAHHDTSAATPVEAVGGPCDGQHVGLRAGFPAGAEVWPQRPTITRHFTGTSWTRPELRRATATHDPRDIDGSSQLRV